jgi:hypothetical protein
MRRAGRFALRAAAAYGAVSALALAGLVGLGGSGDGACAVKDAVVVFWVLGLPSSIALAEPLGMQGYFGWAQGRALCHMLVSLPFIAAGAAQWATLAALHGHMLDLFDKAGRD